MESFWALMAARLSNTLSFMALALALALAMACFACSIFASAFESAWDSTPLASNLNMLRFTPKDGHTQAVRMGGVSKTATLERFAEGVSKSAAQLHNCA
jgi:hypothetical protein